VDPRDSPYAPGAGTTPAILAGRTAELERFSVLVDRLARGRSAEAVLFAGSRGMGKTVVLRACERVAREKGWFTAFEEVDRQFPLRQIMALNAREVLYEMSASRRYGERIKRALGVLKAFTSIGVLGVTLNIDADMIPGTADTGIFKRDLLALFKELGEIAATDESGVVFFLDELHTLRDSEEMAVLDAVIHGVAQSGLPVTVVGAGVFAGPGYRDPDDPGTPSSYAGRLYRVIRLRPLSRESASEALTGPAREAGVAYDDAALDMALEFAGGSPWFLQLIGEEVWEETPPDSAVTTEHVAAAIERVQARLDAEFYPRLIGPMVPEQNEVLSWLARLGGVAVSRAEVAERSRLDAGTVHNALYALNRSDVIQVAGRGSYSFTVPGTGDYLSRAGITPEQAPF
jgi:hypothetical protein